MTSPCPRCGHTRHYAGGGLLSCANPACARWLTPDAESVTVADAPTAAQTERTVTIESVGRKVKRGKRGKR